MAGTQVSKTFAFNLSQSWHFIASHHPPTSLILLSWWDLSPLLPPPPGLRHYIKQLCLSTNNCIYCRFLGCSLRLISVRQITMYLGKNKATCAYGTKSYASLRYQVKRDPKATPRTDDHVASFTDIYYNTQPVEAAIESSPHRRRHALRPPPPPFQGARPRRQCRPPTTVQAADVPLPLSPSLPLSSP